MKALFLGDFSPSDDNRHLFAAKDMNALFADSAKLFEGNFLNFVNLECALTDHDKSIDKFGPPLKALPITAEVLRDLGVNLCGLSNNHIFDFGKKGATDTMENLDKVGIPYTGFGMDLEDSRCNYTATDGNEMLTVLAVCEHEYSYALENRMGSRPYDEYDTMADIRAAKANGGRVVVIYHGGKEHCRYPSPRLLKLCRAMADNGADLVICQHSHCIGCYEQYKGCHILYGQGNFHFERPSDTDLPESWNGCLSVHYDSSAHTVEFTPIVSNGIGGVRLANAEEKKSIMRDFYARNAELADGRWKQGWHAFCEFKRPVYEKVISRALVTDSTDKENHKFAHYLDCEAHTDVWRELYKTANHTNETD